MPDDTKTMRRPEASELSKAWETTCTAMLDSHQQTVTHWFHLLRSLADEVSTLAATRLQLTMEAYSALAACRSPEELIDCNRRIASKMTEHCSEEIAKLSQMTMRMVTRTEPDAH